MPKPLSNKGRFNVSLEKPLKAAGASRAASLKLRGGLSELLARLLNKHLEGCGRDVLKMPLFFDPKRVAKVR